MYFFFYFYFFNLEIDHMFNLTFHGYLIFNFVLFIFFFNFEGVYVYLGLPLWLRQLKKISLQCRRSGFNDLWVWKIPWSREWQHTPVFLPGKFHGQRSLVGHSSWGHKESDTTERLTRTHMYTCGWFTLWYGRNHRNVVKQLYSNKIFLKSNPCFSNAILSPSLHPVSLHFLYTFVCYK